MIRDGWSGRRVTKARLAVRARGQIQLCARCGRPIDLDRERWHVDHLIELVYGGSMDDPTNHGPAHGRCNEAAGGRIGGARTAAQRRTDNARQAGTWRW